MIDSTMLLVTIAVGVLSVLMTVVPTRAQEPIGIFTDSGDVGDPAIAGSVAYDAKDQTYRLRASGTNMWGAENEFQFAWRRLSGDFIVRAHVRLLGEGVDPHRKLGVIARAGLEADAPYVDAAVHGDGLTSAQYRRSAGGETAQDSLDLSGADVVQLERRGDRYFVSAARFGAPFQTVEVTAALPDSLYVGLFLCAHNPDVVEEAVFENVRIVVPPTEGFEPYRDFIGSNLEIMNLETGHRRVIYRHPHSIQAPNWTLDGRALIYNSGGRLYRFDLESGTPTEIPTGSVVQNNNDHVISFDGEMLGISSHDSAKGGSSVYVVPVEGGEPVAVTEQAPSYLHGWSPDGAWLVYTAERGDGNYDIYKIPSGGGEEVRLTTAEGLDDGPEYTPDGTYIYFNSTRSGLMQIWRMRPDGSEQEQVTNDAFNNWFPHIAPDGQSIVFLSYGQDVAPDDHPFYKHVYLRSMPIDGGDSRIIAYVYGGQGTINVPSFSPDGRFVAFVSNTDLPIPRP